MHRCIQSTATLARASELGQFLGLTHERWAHITDAFNHPEMRDYMTTMQFNCDEISDTLYITFTPGELATGIELNDHLLLRINKRE